MQTTNNDQKLRLLTELIICFRSLSPVPLMNGHINPPLPKLSETLPRIVPDASNWSIDDVVDYFKRVGFVEQSEVFKDQV